MACDTPRPNAVKHVHRIPFSRHAKIVGEHFVFIAVGLSGFPELFLVQRAEHQTGNGRRFQHVKSRVQIFNHSPGRRQGSLSPPECRRIKICRIQQLYPGAAVFRIRRDTGKNHSGKAGGCVKRPAIADDQKTAGRLCLGKCLYCHFRADAAGVSHNNAEHRLHDKLSLARPRSFNARIAGTIKGDTNEMTVRTMMKQEIGRVKKIV